jgi:hypothetical protein
MRHGRFACRHCQKISYQSQSGDAEDRLIWQYHSLLHKMSNKKLQPPRSRVHTSNKFLEVAWQFDSMLDSAMNGIGSEDVALFRS